MSERKQKAAAMGILVICIFRLLAKENDAPSLTTMIALAGAWVCAVWIAPEKIFQAQLRLYFAALLLIVGIFFGWGAVANSANIIFGRRVVLQIIPDSPSEYYHDNNYVTVRFPNGETRSVLCPRSSPERRLPTITRWFFNGNLFVEPEPTGEAVTLSLVSFASLSRAYYLYRRAKLDRDPDLNL